MPERQNPHAQPGNGPDFDTRATTTASPDPTLSDQFNEKTKMPRRSSPTATAHTADDSNFTIFESAPPPLNYTIKEHKRERKILLWATLLFVEAGVLPLILFFSLRWGAHLSTTKNLAIITSLIGSVSGYKFATRMWYLYFNKDANNHRPIGAGRWGVDYFQVILSLCMAAFFIPLIIGSSVSPADPRIVALALPCVILTLTLPLLITGLFPHSICLPARVSSFPKWEPLPPLTYCFVEDVVAVDGGGCTEFRQAWRLRYEESIVIRRLIRYTALLWGITGLVVGAVLIAVSRFAGVDTAYGVCYGIPWLWAMVTAAATGAWTHQELEREKREWVATPTATREGPVHKEHMLPIKEGKYDPPRISGSIDGGRPARQYSMPAMTTTDRAHGSRGPSMPPSPIAVTDRRAHTFDV